MLHSNGICHTGLLTACEQDQDGTAMVVLHSNDICHTGLLTACEQDQDGTAMVVLHSNGICHTGLLTACEQDQDVRPDPARQISAFYSIATSCGDGFRWLCYSQTPRER